jgi:uncharacterized protein
MKLFNKLVAAVFVSLSFAALAFGYSNPGSPTGYINDYAKILSTSWVQIQNNSLQEFETKTSVEIAVVAIPNLGGDTIENYAVKLFEDWKIGQKGKDNGLLLLISQADHEVRIEIGYGLEETITDSESNHIIQDLMIPNLKNGNTEGAITAALDEIKSKIDGTGKQETSSEEKWQTYNIDTSSLEKFSLSFVIGFIGAFIIGIMRFIEFLKRGKQKKLWWIVLILGAVIGLGTFLVPGSTTGDVINATIANLIVYNIIYWFGGALITILQLLSIFGGGSSGRGGFGGGGGFGGFGGGRSGGGGASGKW